MKTVHTYIYLNYARREQQTAAEVISSLLRQVLQHSTSETFPDEILSLYNSHKKYGTRPTLKELTDLLAKLTSTYESLFVVIDALDECSECEDDALQLLSTINSVGPNVKILCSSRFSTTFDAFFASTKKLVVFAKDEDITVFLDSEINQQPRLSKHVRGDTELRKDIISSIAGECRGMFLLAKLHLESLSTKINRKAVRLALNTLPRTLDDTYEQALQRIYAQPAETVELAKIVLLWIVCARQNLTVMQLQHMYATQALSGEEALGDDDLPDGEILTGACGGLITVDSESKTIHLIHYTIQEYFERTVAQELMAAKISLAKVSLAYLALPNFSSGFCTSDTAMKQRMEKYPFLDYAAKHWGSDIHLLNAQELQLDIHRFISNPTVIDITSQVRSLSGAHYLNWSQEFPRNSPALVLAASFELPEILRLMISNGHQIDGFGTDKETALIRSAEFGHMENVRVLLLLGAAVDARNYMDETALHRAARNGHAGVIRVLIDGHGDVNNKAYSDWTPLMSAVSSGNIDAVRMLVEAGADVMTETEWGDTALSMAVRSRQDPMTEFLAAHGAVLPGGLAGRRAFIIASQRGLQHLVRPVKIDYEAVAGKPLQRQSSRLIGDLPESHQEETSKSSSDPQTDARASNEVSFGELMEQYNIKTSFHQQYEVMQQLGKGHSATVHLCSNRVTKMLFAVKVFEIRKPLASSTLNPKDYDFNILCDLQPHYHPNIMSMVDVFADFEKNQIRIVLDLAREGELFNVFLARGKLTEGETRHLFTQLLSGIQFLHDHGWVHRDIKPENILVMDEKLTIQIGDLGIAARINTETGFDEFRTTLCGTPSYVAPEIIQQERPYGYKVDVWSSGVVLYICLCGFPPFSDELYTKENPFDLAKQIKMGRFDYPSPYWDAVGDPALELIDKMLTVNVHERFSVRECLSHPWMLGPLP